MTYMISSSQIDHFFQGLGGLLLARPTLPSLEVSGSRRRELKRNRERGWGWVRQAFVSGRPEPPGQGITSKGKTKGSPEVTQQTTGHCEEPKTAWQPKLRTTAEGPPGKLRNAKHPKTPTRQRSRRKSEALSLSPDPAVGK